MSEIRSQGRSAGADCHLWLFLFPVLRRGARPGSPPPWRKPGEARGGGGGGGEAGPGGGSRMHGWGRPGSTRPGPLLRDRLAVQHGDRLSLRNQQPSRSPSNMGGPLLRNRQPLPFAIQHGGGLLLRNQRPLPLAAQHGGGPAGAGAAAAAGRGAGAGGAAVPAGRGPAGGAGGRHGAAGAAQRLGRLGGAVLQLFVRPLHRLRAHLAGPGRRRARWVRAGPPRGEQECLPKSRGIKPSGTCEGRGGVTPCMAGPKIPLARAHLPSVVGLGIPETPSDLPRSRQTDLSLSMQTHRYERNKPSYQKEKNHHLRL